MAVIHSHRPLNRGMHNPAVKGEGTVSIFQKIRRKDQTAKGEARKSAGRMTGNRGLRTKGRAEKATGDAKQAATKSRTPLSTELAGAKRTPTVACGYGYQ